MGQHRTKKRQHELSSLESCIDRVLDAYGVRKEVGRHSLYRHWPLLVGPRIAAAAMPVKIDSDGRLHVAVTSTTWLQELGFMQTEVVRKLNVWLSENEPQLAPLSGLHLFLHRR